MGAGAPPSLRRPATASQLSPSPPASRRRRSPGTGFPPWPLPAQRTLRCSSSLAEDQAGPFSGGFRAALAEDEDDGNSQGLLARYFRMPSLVARTIVDCPKRGQDSSNRADGTCFQGASKSPVPFGQFDQRRVRLSGPACGCGVMGMSFISGTKKVSGTLGLRERHVSCIGG